MPTTTTVMQGPTPTTYTVMNKLYKSAVSCPLPTRDDILSLLLQPYTSPSDLHAITTLLGAASTVASLPSLLALQHADASLRHCVRCHAPYTDARNTHGACIVPHVFTGTNHRFVWIEGELYAAAGCCNRFEKFLSTIGSGEDARARLTQVGSGVCYRGYHTEDPGEVEMEGGYNDVNVRRCDEGECMQESPCAEEEAEEAVDPLTSSHGLLEMTRVKEFFSRVSKKY